MEKLEEPSLPMAFNLSTTGLMILFDRIRFWVIEDLDIAIENGEST
jgi:hypothetical protein